MRDCLNSSLEKTSFRSKTLASYYRGRRRKITVSTASMNWVWCAVAYRFRDRVSTTSEIEKIFPYLVVLATSLPCSKSFPSLGRWVAWVAILSIPLSSLCFYLPPAEHRISGGVKRGRRPVVETCGDDWGECVSPTALCLPYCTCR